MFVLTPRKVILIDHKAHNYSDFKVAVAVSNSLNDEIAKVSKIIK